MGLPETTPIGPLANYDLITLDRDDFLFNALVLMTERAIRHVVVTREGEIVGPVRAGGPARLSLQLVVRHRQQDRPSRYRQELNVGQRCIAAVDPVAVRTAASSPATSPASSPI